MIWQKHHISIFFMAVSRSRFHHDSLVFHIGSDYFMSYSKVRDTVLLTNILSAYVWSLVPQNDLVLNYELLHAE